MDINAVHHNFKIYKYNSNQLTTPLSLLKERIVLITSQPNGYFSVINLLF